MQRLSLKTSACSSKTSLVKIAKKPFKSNGEFFPAGSLIEDTAGIKLYKRRVLDGYILTVDEHNLDETIYYLTFRQGVSKDGCTKIADAVKYEAKVYSLADKYNIDTKDVEFSVVVDNVRKAVDEANKDKKTEK